MATSTLRASPAAPDPIGGAGERDRSAGVDRSDDGHARARLDGTGLALGGLGAGRGPVPAALGVGGDEDAGVEDLDEPSLDDDLDRFAGEGRTHPIAEAVEPDRAALVDPPTHPGRS